MKRIALCFLQDDKGNYSHARLIALLVGFSATFFMWKLMVMGEMTTDYFLYYLSYGVIHMNVSKALDVMNNFFGGRYEVPTASAGGRGATRSEGDAGRGGHAGRAGRDVLPPASDQGEETAEEAAARRRLAAQQD